MKNLKQQMNKNLSKHTQAVLAFCLPMVIFCLAVSWGIEAVAREMFRY